MPRNRNKEHAREWRIERTKVLRARLFNLIGTKCTICNTTKDLEVDHVRERNWPIHHFNQYDRVLFYLKELKCGVKLQPLCHTCNVRKGGKNRQQMLLL